MLRSPFLASAFLLTASIAIPAQTPPNPPLVSESYVRSTLSALADDSMAGRLTGTPGTARAAKFIAAQMRAAHLVPAGPDGFYQRVPLFMTPDGMEIPSTPADTVGKVVKFDANIIGLIRGSDPALANEYVLVDAHYDHLGIGKPVHGDSIYNGADDDASGVVAVLAIARAIAAGPPPKRSILFVATTGEEVGLLGTRWLIAHFPVPLDSVKANLEIEMIGRPDSLIGPDQAWLTGFERTTMGAIFHAEGLPIVADPHPEQHFFERSDNIAYAQLGIPAQTLSSFGLHRDYHQPSDDLRHVKIAHIAAVIDAAVRAVRLLADGPLVEWLPGGRPPKE